MSAQIPAFPSFKWMRGVSDDTRISVIYRLVLLRLCIHRRQKDGRCNPGYQTVADELGVYRTTVLKAVDLAVRLGWFAPPIRSRRANASFVFTLPIARDQEVASEHNQEVAQQSNFLNNQEVAPDELRSRSKLVKKSLAQRASQASSNTSTRNVLRTSKENGCKSQTLAPDFFAGDSKKDSRSKKSLRKKAQASPAESFERFWALYPRRVAKEAARKAFEAAIKGGADADAIIAGAKVYALVEQARIGRGEDPKYTAHAATWLRGKRWEDPPPDGVTLDEHGDVVAIEQPRASSNGRGFESIADEMIEDARIHGAPWSWGQS